MRTSLAPPAKASRCGFKSLIVSQRLVRLPEKQGTLTEIGTVVESTRRREIPPTLLSAGIVYGIRIRVSAFKRGRCRTR